MQNDHHGIMSPHFPPKTWSLLFAIKSLSNVLFVYGELHHFHTIENAERNGHLLPEHMVYSWFNAIKRFEAALHVFCMSFMD